MKNSDSIALLQECNSGSKMAISSIRDVLGDIQEEKLERLLENYIHKHEEYGEELHALLSANQSPPEEPKASAKTMAKVVTGVKLFADHSTSQIANLMIDGCNMGVKSLNKYLNQYEAADEKTKDITKRLINLEEKLVIDIRQFL